jgi:hypothetical protein
MAKPSTPEEPISFVDHPVARARVISPPAGLVPDFGFRVLERQGILLPNFGYRVDEGKGKHQWLQPRKVRPPPIRIIPEKRPLYYLDGVTGYDRIQHRPSSGLYGGRIFSTRSNTAPVKISSPAHAASGRVSRMERSVSSMGSYSLRDNEDFHVGPQLNATVLAISHSQYDSPARKS